MAETIGGTLSLAHLYAEPQRVGISSCGGRRQRRRVRRREPSRCWVGRRRRRWRGAGRQRTHVEDAALKRTWVCVGRGGGTSGCVEDNPLAHMECGGGHGNEQRPATGGGAWATGAMTGGGREGRGGEGGAYGSCICEMATVPDQASMSSIKSSVAGTEVEDDDAPYEGLKKSPMSEPKASLTLKVGSVLSVGKSVGLVGTELGGGGAD